MCWTSSSLRESVFRCEQWKEWYFSLKKACVPLIPRSMVWKWKGLLLLITLNRQVNFGTGYMVIWVKRHRYLTHPFSFSSFSSRIQSLQRYPSLLFANEISSALIGQWSSHAGSTENFPLCHSFPNPTENLSPVLPHTLPCVVTPPFQPHCDTNRAWGGGTKGDGSHCSAKSTGGHLKQQLSYWGRRNAVLWIQNLWKHENWTPWMWQRPAWGLLIRSTRVHYMNSLRNNNASVLPQPCICLKFRPTKLCQIMCCSTCTANTKLILWVNCAVFVRFQPYNQELSTEKGK